MEGPTSCSGTYQHGVMHDRHIGDATSKLSFGIYNVSIFVQATPLNYQVRYQR